MILRNRKLNRKPQYDYSQNGYYFVTICTKNRIHWFGEIQNNKMNLNKFGEYTKQCWQNIPNHFPNINIDEYVIMPDHVHGILIIDDAIGDDNHDDDDVGDNNYCPLRPTRHDEQTPWQTKWSRSISSSIRGFKIGVTKYFRQNDNNVFEWQRSFYDRIIRNEFEYQKIKKYIFNNPINWEK
ncbi:hypothetical protein KBD45_04825 [Candidatus Dojkabacteria bacterium]|nr:hypothetical protein [Candidatus Dojkabacteria bacterium]